MRIIWFYAIFKRKLGLFTPPHPPPPQKRRNIVFGINDRLLAFLQFISKSFNPKVLGIKLYIIYFASFPKHLYNLVFCLWRTQPPLPFFKKNEEECSSFFSKPPRGPILSIQILINLNLT